VQITRSATERAKPISCVTQSIVMPSFASSIITSRTSLIISGECRRRLVEQQGELHAGDLE